MTPDSRPKANTARSRREIREVIAAIKALRRGRRLGGLSIRKMIREGRRF